LRRHIDGFGARQGRAMRWANLDANAASSAILDVELQSEDAVGIAAGVDRSRLESGRTRFVGIHQPRAIVKLGADDRMRTGECALAALDAAIGLPNRHLVRG